MLSVCRQAGVAPFQSFNQRKPPQFAFSRSNYPNCAYRRLKIRRQRETLGIEEGPMHLTTVKHLVWLMTGLLVTIQPAAAGSLSFLPDREDAYLTFYLDNDLFAGTDSNYTNGVRLSFGTSMCFLPSP
jgi:hypothetical protein